MGSLGRTREDEGKILTSNSKPFHLSKVPQSRRGVFPVSWVRAIIEGFLLYMTFSFFPTPVQIEQILGK